MTASIRLATPADVPAIAEFTTDTFAWGDYVAEELPEWLEDPDNQVAVATDDSDNPIAVARVRMLSDVEGWLSAARVRPEHRRRGLGSALNDWCVEWIREQGGKVARLMTEPANEPAHRQVTSLGYRPVATVVNGERKIPGGDIEPATNGGRRIRAEERLDRAPRAETDGGYIAWSTSDLARAAHGMFAVEEWAWRRMTRADAHSSRAWFCPSGWIMGDEDGDALVVRWMVSTPEDATRLVRATVDMAQERGFAGLRMALPRLGWVVTALEANGLTWTEDRVYEKAL